MTTATNKKIASKAYRESLKARIKTLGIKVDLRKSTAYLEAILSDHDEYLLAASNEDDNNGEGEVLDSTPVVPVASNEVKRFYRFADIAPKNHRSLAKGFA